MRQHLAALRILIVLTVITGVVYPAVITLAAQLPGLKAHADGSLVKADGRTVGSSLLGQAFTGDQWFQSRPGGYDPTASGASNLGPESIVDAPVAPSLLTQVCTRSLQVGEREHVDGSRPFCTSGGVGAVLAVFWSGPGFAGHVVRAVSINEPCPAAPFLTTYAGAPVTCGAGDVSKAEVVPVRGEAPSHPAVPADAVTASGSGLDPDISPAYAELQVPRVAAARGLSVTAVEELVKAHTHGRQLGFLGEPTVDVLQLNVALGRD